METSSNQKTYALLAGPANRKRVLALEQSGAKIFQFAPLEIRPLNVAANSAIIKKNLNRFDWIIFPDVYTVDYFLEILNENEIDLFELDALQVVALGESVADRLRFVQLHADIIPHTVKIEIVLTALIDYLGKENLAGLNFLFPRETLFNSELKDKLREAGADVTEILIYQAEISEKNISANLKALLKGGAVDEFIVTSAEDVIALKHHLSTENLAEALSEVKISGVDEVSMQTLRENDLRPAFFHLK